MDLESTINQMLGMYEAGCSDNQVCARLRFTHAHFKKLQMENPVFRDAVNMGHILQKAWWEDQGHTNLSNKNFNASLYGLIMKNRYGYGEKMEIKSVTTEEIEASSTDELENRLLSLMPSFAKVLRDRGVDDTEILKLASAG